MFLSAAAQYSVSCEVTDSTGTGEPFATMRVFKPELMEKPVAIGTTDVDGNFSIELKESGHYELTVTSVGKSTLAVPFEVTPASPTANLGTLIIHNAENSLAEVEVVAQRPLVTAGVDRISYDVQGDEDSKTNTIIEMLRKVPLVTVDGENNILVKGQSNFKIYKNGRPNSAFSNNPKEVLSSIPASMIKRIEVITEPGAKYDAEGVGGILNIVTLDNTMVTGILGNLSASYGTNGQPSANAYITSQIGKVTTSLNYGYFGMTDRSTKSRNNSETFYTESGESFRASGTGKNPGPGNYLQLEGSYELDSLNLFTLSFGGFFYNIKPQGQSTTEFFNPDGSLSYSMTQSYSFPRYDYYDFNGKFDYQRLTRHKGESIIFSYLMSTTTDKTLQRNLLDEGYNVPFDYTEMEIDKSLRFWEHTFQLDYTRPFGEKHKLNMGAKYILRDNHSDQTQSYNNGIVNPTDFSHTTNVAALYAEYLFHTGAFDFRAGLRYEYSYLGAKYKIGDTPDFSQHLNDFAPAAGINWRINPFNSLKLSFATRINRPGISYLNPAIVDTPITVQYGNPDLSSATSRSLNLSYMLMKQTLMLSTSLTYDFSNDGISSVSYVEGDKIYNTYGNIARSRRINLDAYVQWRATPTTSLMLNASWGYGRISNRSLGIANGRWGGYLYGQVSQMLPWKLRLELSGMYYKAQAYDLYSNAGSQYDYNIGLSRSFLKDDRLTVRLNAQNPFSGEWMKYSSRTVYGDHIGWSDHYQRSRNFRITLSWRFGSLNAQVKKTVKTIENDDVVGGATRNSSNTQ